MRELIISEDARSTAGFLLLTIVAVEYGGTFTLRIVRGRVPMTPFQQTFARAGHAPRRSAGARGADLPDPGGLGERERPPGDPCPERRAGRRGPVPGRLLPLVDGKGSNRAQQADRPPVRGRRNPGRERRSFRRITNHRGDVVTCGVRLVEDVSTDSTRCREDGELHHSPSCECPLCPSIALPRVGTHRTPSGQLVREGGVQTERTGVQASGSARIRIPRRSRLVGRAYRSSTDQSGSWTIGAGQGLGSPDRGSASPLGSPASR
jgi:hypothetical protein